MQTAALFALHGTTYNQVSGDYQVAEFDQVMADLEIGVKLVNFPHQQANSVFGPFQPLGGAYYAYIVPHETAQFVPVMGNNHFLVGVGYPAFIPLGQGR